MCFIIKQNLSGHAPIGYTPLPGPLRDPAGTLHMLSTSVLHILMQNYVCALQLWVPVETFVIGIEFKLGPKM